MSTERCERLSAQDASFLLFEGPNNPMNVGGTSIYQGGSLVAKDGAADVDRIKRHIHSRVHLVPRYRQRLAYIPIENQPAWIDDDQFDLDYHVHHVALPRRGDESHLKRISAEILAQPLDRRKPLWELWIVEGLPGGRFATVTKAHHCMIDGVSGLDLTAAMMSTEPQQRIKRPAPWRPRRTPSGAELLRDDILQRVRLSLQRPAAARAANASPSDFAERLIAIWESLESGLRGAANTPFNQPTGPQRRFDWLCLDRAEIKEVKRRLDGTVNDVVLATVAGAVRRFLKRRRVAIQGVDFRVAIPVNVRSAGEEHVLGNRVSVWLAQLPIQEPDAARRLAKVSGLTRNLKKSKRALGTDTLIKVGEWAGSTLLTLGVRFAARVNPYNLIVTNVPGPQFPLYMLDARLLQAYPLVPLFENQGLGVALFSYDGQMCFGFNADWALVPDLEDFVEDVRTSFAELRGAARLQRQAAKTLPATRRHLATAARRGRQSARG
jgi:WS/DGAT/MGAT family acyltransferase